jgi:hypothetical protein
MSDTPLTDTDQSPDDPSRRRLFRILLALAIGIPVAIEASTFFGMLSGERGDGAADIGDELLPDTPQTETLLDSSVYEGPPRQYELVVGVENQTETDFELTVGPLFTDAGDRVSGTVTREVPAGESRELRARWELDGETMPEAVRVRGTADGEETTERVALARPAVYSGTPDSTTGAE